MRFDEKITLFILTIVLVFVSRDSIADEFVYDENGSLIIIQNENSVNYSYQSDGSLEINVVPNESQRTYIYGTDELKIIQPTEFGTFTY
ncbi:MAG: hypothetical protein ISP79_06560 [Methylophilaceae bacterium]|nr:hypothetical protein [Methylophilaceae bacterium]